MMTQSGFPRPARYSGEEGHSLAWNDEACGLRQWRFHSSCLELVRARLDQPRIPWAQAPLWPAGQLCH